MSSEKKEPPDENKSPSKFDIVMVVLLSLGLMAFMAYSFSIGVVR